MVNKKKEVKADVHISNCTFTGLHWDSKAIEAVNIVAKGLLNLTELFKTQNVNIESMIKIDQPKVESKNKTTKTK